MDLTFRETRVGDVEQLFDVRAATRENPLGRLVRGGRWDSAAQDLLEKKCSRRWRASSATLAFKSARNSGLLIRCPLECIEGLAC